MQKRMKFEALPRITRTLPILLITKRPLRDHRDVIEVANVGLDEATVDLDEGGEAVGEGEGGDDQGCGQCGPLLRPQDRCRACRSPIAPSAIFA